MNKIRSFLRDFSKQGQEKNKKNQEIEVTEEREQDKAAMQVESVVVDAEQDKAAMQVESVVVDAEQDKTAMQVESVVIDAEQDKAAVQVESVVVDTEQDKSAVSGKSEVKSKKLGGFFSHFTEGKNKLFHSNLLTYHYLLHAAFLAFGVFVLEVLILCFLLLMLVDLFPLEKKIFKVIFDENFSDKFVIVGNELNESKAVSLAVNYFLLYESFNFNETEGVFYRVKKLQPLISDKLYQKTLDHLLSFGSLVIELDVIRKPMISDAKVISSSGNEMVVQIEGKLIEDFHSFKKTVFYDYIARIKVEPSDFLYDQQDLDTAGLNLGFHVGAYTISLSDRQEKFWETNEGLKENE